MIGMGAAGGAPNLYGLSDFGTSPYQTTAGKTVVGSPPATPAVFICAGQSLIANQGNSLFTPTNTGHVLDLNIYDGVVYRAADPLLGATGTAGSMVARIGDKLVTAAKYTDVVLVSIAIGGSTVGQWTSAGEPNASSGAPGAWLSHRLITAIRRVRQQGWTPTAILWEQGNQDATNGTSSANWQARFNDLVTTASGAGYSGKWIVAQDSMVSNVTNSTIRAAQAAVVGGQIIAGPDIDTLTGGTNRQGDGTHLTDTGNDSAATLWKNVIVAAL